MKKVIISEIYYNPKWDRFTLRDNEKEYFGELYYKDKSYIIRSFDVDYLVEFKNINVINKWLEAMLERYYFSNQNLHLDEEKLKESWPFLKFEVIEVESTIYIIKIVSEELIFGYNINDYYVVHTYYELRVIKQLYPVGEGKILENLKSRALQRANELVDKINKII